MPTAQEILNSIIGINGFTINTEATEFIREKMTAIIGIMPIEQHKAICDGCGQTVSSIKDRSIRIYRDKPSFDWKVYLRVFRRRVNCPRCGVRSERYDRYRGPLRSIRWLGVDEICFGGMNDLYTIVTDLEQGAVIGVVDGHQTISLNA